MPNLQLTQSPTVQTAMLIRKPPDEVFEAFVNPNLITKFWFTNSSGRLEAGRTVVWEWEMYGIRVPITAKAVEPPTRIVLDFPSPLGLTQVEWRFTAMPAGTFVEVIQTGLVGDGDELVKTAMDAVQGFTIVLAGAKAWLEHGIQLELVSDRFPKGK